LLKSKHIRGQDYRGLVLV